MNINEITNKILHVLLVNVTVSVAFGLFLFFITKSAELGLMLGIALFIISLRVFHPMRFRMITERVETDTKEQEQNRHNFRGLETAGIILFGLVLGMLTFLFTHRPWPAVLVSFCFIVPIFFLRVKGSNATRPNGNAREDKTEQ